MARRNAVADVRDALVLYFGEERAVMRIEDGYRAEYWPCPACNHAELVLRLDWRAEAVRCQHGCRESAIRTALCVAPRATRGEPATAQLEGDARDTDRSGRRGEDDLSTSHGVSWDKADQRTKACVDDLGRDRAAAERAARFLGMTGSFVDPVLRCPLPDHHDRAAVRLDPLTGLWKLRCSLSGTWFRLSQVRAAIAGRDPLKLSRLEEAVWYGRLWHEVGLLEPVGVILPALGRDYDGPKYVADVREGFALLVGLRWRWHGHHGQPIGFARTFAGAWCGLTPKQAYTAFRWMRDHGDVMQRGTSRRLKLWLPAGNDP